MRRDFERQSRCVTLRQSSQGALRALVWVKKVWLWDGQGGRARGRLLVVHQEADGAFKYSLSNAAPATAWECLAHMQAQRYWIEHSFGEAKGELGLAHYEVRSWRGWHHHIAMVALAQLFTVRERLLNEEAMPLLSARDIVELLAHYLPRRERTEQEIFRQLKDRHQRRAQAAASHAKRRRKRSLKT